MLVQVIKLLLLHIYFLKEELELASTADSTLSSVAKALRVLKAFNTNNAVWRVGELADELGYSKSTISRILQTLVEEGFVVQDPDNPGYRLGPETLALGGHFVSDNELYQEVAPVLNKLVLETGESAHIAVKNNGNVLYLNKIIGSYYANIETQTGAANPLHATSSGKVLLAYSTPEEIEMVLSGDLPAYTEHTLTNPIKLRKDLENIKEKGYSFSAEELSAGNYSIAAPVFDYEGNIVCAITLVGPVTRLTQTKKDRFILLIQRSASEASERLGYDGF